MTKAICWRCGNSKLGAFVPCPSCGCEPFEDPDILLSLYLAEHFMSESMLLYTAEHIRSGRAILVPADVLEVVRSTLFEIKRISGIGSAPLSNAFPSSLAAPASIDAHIRRFHEFVTSRQLLSSLFFHFWRTSLILVLVFSVLSAFNGDLFRLWNPLAFLVVQIGVGYSFASLFLGMSTPRLRFKKSRSYMLAAIAALSFLIVGNQPLWSIPFVRAELSPFLLSLWALFTGILAALRGDFDSAT